MVEKKAKRKTEKKPKKLEEFKKSNEEVEKIIEKAQRGEDIEIEKEIKKDIEAKKEESKEKTKEIIPELEREYTIPLRKKVFKAPKYRRAKKAIRVIREFLARHMKVEDRDLNKIKIDKYLNQEIWFRGIKKPPLKIKVKAKKINGIVTAELAEIPEKVKFDIAREEKAKKAGEKIKKFGIEKREKPAENKEEEKDKEEKKKASVEAGLIEHEREAKEIKHTTERKGRSGERFERPESQFKRKAMKR